MLLACCSTQVRLRQSLAEPLQRCLLARERPLGSDSMRTVSASLMYALFLNFSGGRNSAGILPACK